MKSMTGYGRGATEIRERQQTIEVEITSVNRKTLDVQVNAPREWPNIQQKCIEWLDGSYTRGRLQIQFKVTVKHEQSSPLMLDHERLDGALQAIQDYASKRNIEYKPNAKLLLDLSKVLKEEKNPTEWKDLEKAAEGAFKSALSEIHAMREREGTLLTEDIRERIDLLSSVTRTIEMHSKETTSQHRDALLERLRQCNLEIDLSDERLLKELALFADRSDISEEITRLDAHLKQFLEFIQSSEASGRKMDFLCQEIHRELNTTGSKSTQIEITRAVIEGKNTLERIREQVQNIE